MIYAGIFKNRDEEDIEVLIDTNDGDTGVERIDQDSSDIRLAKDPIVLESEMDDLFSVIIVQSCTINLLVKPYLGGILFGKNSRDIRVNIWKNGTCLFAGYIEPQVYDQPFNKSWDQLTLTAYDGLGSLQYYMYGDLQTEDDYSNRKAQLDSVTIADALAGSMKNIMKLDLKNDTTSAILYDNSVKLSASGNAGDIFDNVKLYEALFMGETFDDLWESDKTVEEILKYYNLHIRQQGLNYYIYHLASIGQAVTWEPVLGTSTEAAFVTDSETYRLVMDSYLPDGQNAREKLVNIANPAIIVPGNLLTEVLSDDVEQVGSEWRRYYYFILPNRKQVKSNKYIVVDVSDDLIYINKPGENTPYKILNQSVNGDYDYDHLEEAPSEAYFGGTFTKSSFKVKENDFIIAAE